MTNRAPIGPREVLTEACRLAEELSTTPTQQMIADNLDCSKQHISNMFVTLRYVEAIVWVTKNHYAIKNSQWIPPPDSPV